MTLDAAHGSAPGICRYVYQRAPYDANNTTTSTTMTNATQRETHRRRVGGPNRPRPRRKSFSWRSLALASAVPRHCLTYGEHNAAPKEKDDIGRGERRNGLSGRFAVSASATERQKVRPLPNNLSVFVSRLIYEWGPRETEPAPAVSLSLSFGLFFRPVGSRWHTRLAVFTACRFLSLPFGVETPVKTCPLPSITTDVPVLFFF